MSGEYNKFQLFGESLREAYEDSKSNKLRLVSFQTTIVLELKLTESNLFTIGPDPDNPSIYVNFHAFAANLFERRIFPTDPTWAIWAQREAHEKSPVKEPSIRAAYVLAAAQWIMWSGQSLFKQVIFTGDVSPNDLQCWTPGPLYGGDSRLSLRRWRFWKDSFSHVAFGGEKEEEAFVQESNKVAAKASQLMDSLERSMTH